ncbi:hypothetical protein B296_00023268 [Ensete ventricosum]|uniref:Uncharacterized protein n=1 Tax=Ensete ventricosum TaxID=4639 RepID=A0A426ZN17_ENSVE|nr:hypothetical protein B296_00023268 [Ensete ventricosum]
MLWPCSLWKRQYLLLSCLSERSHLSMECCDVFGRIAAAVIEFEGGEPEIDRVVCALLTAVVAGRPYLCQVSRTIADSTMSASGWLHCVGSIALET